MKRFRLKKWMVMSLIALMMSLSLLGGFPGKSKVAYADQLTDLTSFYTAMDHSKGWVDLSSNNISYLIADQANLSSGLTVTDLDGGKPYKGKKVTDWSSAAQQFSWTVKSTIASNYYVDALINGSSGVVVQVSNGSSNASYTIGSNGWDKLRLGQISIPVGTSTVTIKALSGSINMQLKSLELIPSGSLTAIQTSIANSKSKATWMTSSPVGVMYQWGQWGSNPDGTQPSWPTPYANFDYNAFADRVANMGADFVVWSITWTSYYVPAPITSIDNVLTGRTSSVDYLDKMLTALKNKGIRVMFYYHTGHDSNPNLNWWNNFWTVSPNGNYARKESAINKWQNIVAEIGNRYGTKLDGWMFDDGALYYPAPYESLTASARAGNSDRLVSFNSSYVFDAGPRLTDYEDYFFGEGNSGDLFDSAISNGKYTSGPFKGEFAFGNFQTEAGDWGVRTGDTSPITTTMSFDTFNSTATKAKDTKQAMAYNMRMWTNMGQSQTSIDRFTAASAAAHSSGGVTTIDPTKWYKIQSKSNPNYVLDISTVNNGGRAQVGQYVGNDRQQFKFIDVGGGYYRIAVRNNTNYGIDVSGTPANGTVTQSWEYVGNDRQQFLLTNVGDSNFKIAVRNNPSYVIDVDEPANGVQLKTWQYVGNNRQQWQLVEVQ
ncbi:RICIN domain-containing protein [Paenibacillus ferrarius]|uniref:RICIN domain-containing protein n=1 Tax=Paenibacillus ferrarius TaxID=1469647 RepID=UPI001301E37C|nr:RICIN domain-containing protein [Paenibacillus ferrarius]